VTLTSTPNPSCPSTEAHLLTAAQQWPASLLPQNRTGQRGCVSMCMGGGLQRCSRLDCRDGEAGRDETPSFPQLALLQESRHLKQAMTQA
jgi:hypothetical protein